MVGKGEPAPGIDRETAFYHLVNVVTAVLEANAPEPLIRQAFRELSEAANVLEHDSGQLSSGTLANVRSIRRLCAWEDFMTWRTAPVFSNTR